MEVVSAHPLRSAFPRETADMAPQEVTVSDLS